MCQIMPLSPEVFVTLPAAMIPPWPSGIACRMTGRPVTPEAVSRSGVSSRDHRLPSGELKTEVPVGPVAKVKKRSFEVVTGPSLKSLVTSTIIGVFPTCNLRAKTAGGGDLVAGGRVGPMTRLPVISPSPLLEPPIMTTRVPMDAMRAWSSGAAALAMGIQFTPSSETHTTSAAAGCGVLPGSVGPALAAAEVVAGAGAPKATRLPPTLATPSRATVDRSVGAVVLVHVLPSVELQDAASPGAVALRSTPTATIVPFRPAMPRTSKPSSEVPACFQSRPVDEYHAAERVVLVSLERPMITNPPFHEPTARGVYVPVAVETPGRISGDQVRPSVESQATPFPAATTAPGREATPAIISWPAPDATCMGVQVLPSRECHAVAITSVGDDPRLLPMTTSPPWPSSERPCATNRRPPMAKAPEPDSWVHVEPSVEAQTVVVGAGRAEHEQLVVEGREVRPEVDLGRRRLRGRVPVDAVDATGGRGRMSAGSAGSRAGRRPPRMWPSGRRSAKTPRRLGRPRRGRPGASRPGPRPGAAE